MTQREKDEKIVDLSQISIAAAEVVEQIPFAQNPRTDAGRTLTRLKGLLDAYNARWGDPEPGEPKEELSPDHTTEYTVTWEMDVEAHDPLHAARRAYDSFVRPGSVAHVFEVTEHITDVAPWLESARMTFVVDIDRGADSNRDGEPVSYPLTEEG